MHGKPTEVSGNCVFHQGLGDCLPVVGILIGADSMTARTVMDAMTI
jgi:hypothetical protein